MMFSAAASLRHLVNPLMHKCGCRYTSGFKYYQILTEPQPDDVTSVVGGIPVSVPSKPNLTGIVESHDLLDWEYVNALLPCTVVPEPQHHDTYPTPSGWIPPNLKLSAGFPYYVARTRFHNFPIYRLVLNGGNRVFTIINKIEGDIWAFDSDVRRYLLQKTGQKTYTKVDEVCRKVWARGTHTESVSEFFIQRGF